MGSIPWGGEGGGGGAENSERGRIDRGHVAVMWSYMGVICSATSH